MHHIVIHSAKQIVQLHQDALGCPQSVHTSQDVLPSQRQQILIVKPSPQDVSLMEHIVWKKMHVAHI